MQVAGARHGGSDPSSVADTKALPLQAFAVEAETPIEARADPSGANAKGGEVSLPSARMAAQVMELQNPDWR
jgi:hypothetical protein